MSDLALMLRLQACVTAFLADLSRDRLVALVEGRLELSVTPRSAGSEPARLPAAPVPVAPVPAAPVPRARRTPAAGATFDADAVAATLRACASLDEGTALLAGLNLSAVHLKSLARALNIPPAGRKDEIAKKILNLTLGSRSKHAGLRQG